jgi:hypothetical protein
MDHVYGAVPPVPCTVVLYAASGMPLGRLAVVMAGGAATDNVKPFESVQPFEPPLTATVNVEEPAVVGNPEIIPELPKPMPEGRLPDFIQYVYGATPPVTVRAWL